jgi:signal peptidase I
MSTKKETESQSPGSSIDMIDTITAILESGNSVVLPATGYSMFPTLRPGDRVLVKPVIKDEMPIPGSIVVFRDNDQLIIHRLIKILQNEEGNDCFEARGDSRPVSDKILPVQHIIGLAVSYKRAGKENYLKCCNPGKFKYLVNRTALWFFFKSKKLSDYFRP